MPQEAFDRTSYQGTEPSGRFAVFEQVIVDLCADRVAWLHDGGILPIWTAENRLLRVHQKEEMGVELWNLLDGRTQLFLGELVPHVGAVGRVALQRGPALDVIDPALVQRVALLPALGEVVSVMPSKQGWRMLARTGTLREQPGLVLLSTPPAPAEGVKALALELPPANFSLVDPTERHSGPFLSLGSSGEPLVNVVETCAACETPARLSLWSSVIDPQSGRGAAWSEARFDLERPPALVMPLVGPHVRRSTPLPAKLEQHLARLRTAPDTGTALDVSPDARYALTGANDRVCVWSLHHGERSWCEARDYQSYQFLDSTHVWMRGQHAGKPELAIWDLTSRHATKRTFSPGTVTLPGPGDRFLSYVFNQKNRSYDVESWRFSSAAPAWTRAGCPAPPYFSSKGAHVACPEIDMDRPVLLLDSLNGEIISDRGPRPRPDYLPEPCELDVAPGVSATISRRARPVATLFDLTDSEWALVLPDGQFHGSADALVYLAFFGPDGTFATRAQVERLRNPSAVKAALSGLSAAIGECTE